MRKKGEALIVLCKCDGKISEILDFASLAESLSERPDVKRVEIVDKLCEEFESLIKLIEEADVPFTVLGCCSPQLYGSLFRRAAACAKLSPFRVEVANLREQCAFPHSSEPSLATEKARLLILAKLERVKAFKEIPESSIKLEPEKEMSRGELLKLPKLGFFAYKLIPYIASKKCLGSICKLCLDACPLVGALKFDEFPLLDREKCQGCGICVNACPFGFIKFPTYDPATIFQEIRLFATEPGKIERRVLLLVCDQSYKALDQIGNSNLSYPVSLFPIHIPCIGMVSVYELLLALSSGIDGIILMVCGECPYGGRLSKVEEVVSGAKEVLSAFGLGSERIGLVVAGEDKASLLGSLTQSFEAIKGLGHFPLRLNFQKRLHDLIRRFVLKLKCRPARIENSSLPIGIVEVDSNRCTLCMACAACPSGAIESEESGEKSLLIFNYDRCVGCGLCERLCPEGAIKVRRVLDIGLLEEPRFSVSEAGLLRCLRCGKPFTAPALLSKFSKIFKEKGIAEEYGEDLWNYCNECRPIVAAKRFFFKER